MARKLTRSFCMTLRTPFQPFGTPEKSKGKAYLYIFGSLYDLDKKTKIEGDRIPVANTFYKNKIIGACFDTSDTNVLQLSEYVVSNNKIQTKVLNRTNLFSGENMGGLVTSFANFVVAHDELFFASRATGAAMSADDASIRKYTLETNSWSDLLCEKYPITEFCYVNGTFWISGIACTGKKCTSTPAVDAWQNISLPGGVMVASYAPRVVETQNELYVTTVGQGGNTSEHLFRFKNNAWEDVFSINKKISFVSRGEDFAALSAGDFYVCLTPGGNFVKQNKPDAGVVYGCIRYGDDFLVLSSESALLETSKLYKTKDFTTYEFVLNGPTGSYYFKESTEQILKLFYI